MTYKIGNKFKIIDKDVKEEVYILCKPNRFELCLINIETGLRWDASVGYEDSQFLIPENIIEMLFNFQNKEKWKEVFTLIQ